MVVTKNPIRTIKVKDIFRQKSIYKSLKDEALEKAEKQSQEQAPTDSADKKINKVPSSEIHDSKIDKKLPTNESVTSLKNIQNVGEKHKESLAGSKISKDPYNGEDDKTPKIESGSAKEKSVPIIKRRYFGGKVSNQGSIENLDAIIDSDDANVAGLETQPASKNHAGSNILNVIDKINKQEIESV
jgi:hypothetical protein